ncbi:MAG TPA: hypothetical protein VNO30_26875 [Kofleriaceae bacterium]|nr:hypothetical protein [Kofleriaceae bacterium]
MPSLKHEVLAELFRERPLLARELLQSCAGIHLQGVTAQIGSIDLSQVAPAEYRSDALTVLCDRAGKAVAAVIVEVQLQEDDDKLLSWPLYVAAARARYRCPATLLVITPDPAVVRWASEPIPLGHPGFVLRPVAIGYAQVPRLSGAAAARAAPQLAVLSAMAHPGIETAATAGAGIALLPEEQQRLYWDVILSGLPASARRTLEASMIKGYVYQSDFARKYVAQGRAEGRAEGLRRAITEGVCARFPGLRNELERQLRDQPEARLVQLAGEVGKAQDKDAVRAILGQCSKRRRAASAQPDSVSATRRRGRRSPSRS